MDFSLSHEQKMLVETVQQFISKELEPLEEEVERSGMLDPDLAEEIKNKSMELGLFAMNVPETFGGTGLTTLDWILSDVPSETFMTSFSRAPRSKLNAGFFPLSVENVSSP